MAKVWVTPYRGVDINSNLVVQVLAWPPLSDPIVIDFTSGAAKGGSALPSGTTYVEIYADAACHIELQDHADAASATTANEPFAAGFPVQRRLPVGVPAGGWGVSAIAMA